MLSEALRLIRVFHDLKQFELAKKLNISKSHLSEIETGSKTPSLELIERYSKVFDIPVSSIMLFAEQLPSSKRGNKARLAVASKIIDLLRFIERKSDENVASH